jgi:hypothetical protein
MRTNRLTMGILLAALLALSAGPVLAAGHGGGGGGKGGGGKGGGGNGGGANGGGGNGGKGMGGRSNNNDDTPDRTLEWQDSYDTALEFSSHGPRPMLVVLARENNEADKKLIELMAAWPVIDDMSKKDIAFVWQTDSSDKGKELIAQLKVKTFPYVVWQDQYGNTIFGQSFPDTASAVQSVVQGWKTTIENVYKFMHDRVAHADKLYAKGKLREAYQEYSIVAPFKGPEADKARAGKDGVLASWKRLLALAGGMKETEHDRASVIKGLQKDTANLDCSKTFADEIAALNKPQTPAKPADAPAVEVAANNAPPAAPVAAAPTTVAAAAPPALVEVKPLKSLVSAPLVMDRESDDSIFDMHFLSESSDERLKNAEKFVKEGLTAYRQACADNMDRGEARNTLLKKAHDLFDQGVQAIDAVNVAKPSAQLDNMMSRISMLMYGCLKYQTL